MIDLGTLKGTIQVDGMSETIAGLENVQYKSESVSTSIDKVGKTIKASLIAVGAVVSAVSVSAIKSYDEFNKSMNDLAAQTGATEEEMNGLHDSLLNIYSQNYGEDYEDIANSLASVKQQTSLTGDALENATINAIALRDTFDWEVDESIRAVDMMVKQFGISADEAYSLLSQGAQNGLDKNQNLLDSVNEYSVHFKQLGFDADEMFNMFANGAETGVFDIDKLGDAVKEFGIRAQDGSNTTIEAFNLLGLNADDLQTKFAAGGESANAAFMEVTKALAECDDKVVQTTAGVNLFGTMYEDLGINAIVALTNINGELDSQKNIMEEIKEIKYDDLGSAFEGIKRQLEVGILIPLGENLLPLINEIANTIQDNMPQIQQVCNTVIGGIGNTINFLIEHLDTIIPLIAGVVAGFLTFQTITAVTSIISTLSGVIGAASSVTAIFNAVLAANPIMLITLAVAALIAAIVALIMNWDDVIKWCGKLWTTISETFTNICNTVNDSFSNIITSVSEWFQDIWENVTNWFSDLFSWFGDLPDKFMEKGEDMFNGLWEGIKNVWSNIVTWVDEKVTWLKDKLMFWKNGQSEMQGDSTTKQIVDGSHANGLSYVPYNGYVAELHKGERVLTASEASSYNQNINQDSGNQITNNYAVSIDASSVREFNDIVDMCKSYTQTTRMG